jgi:hypothetical protein
LKPRELEKFGPERAKDREIKENLFGFRVFLFSGPKRGKTHQVKIIVQQNFGGKNCE